MSCYPLTIWKAAPAEGSAVICFVGLLGFLAMKDQKEVCSLSREVMLLVLSLYPPYSRATFAFSILLYLHVYRRSSRFAFPVGRRTGLPCFD
jgi:hypothetical protein